MRRVGDGVRLTLRPTLDATAATGLSKANGTQYALSDEDRNKLLAIGKPGYHPQRITITLGFCRIVPGASQVSNALVPHIHDVEFVSAEASHA